MSKDLITLECDAARSGRRGRGIPRDTVVRLVAAGAGFCYKPDCPTGFLWHEFEDGSAVKLAQVAHIIAASPTGPRADPAATHQELVSLANLLLLCPTCHVVVDRAPDRFPVPTLEAWKNGHESRVSAIWGVRRFGDRDSLRREAETLLLENRAVWETYGPESDAARTLQPDAPLAWQREVVRQVIPNNSRLLRLLDANTDLLEPSERRVVAAFRLHARGLEERHLGGVVNKFAPRFPAGMNEILLPGV